MSNGLDPASVPLGSTWFHLAQQTLNLSFLSQMIWILPRIHLDPLGSRTAECRFLITNGYAILTVKTPKLLSKLVPSLIRLGTIVA